MEFAPDSLAPTGNMVRVRFVRAVRTLMSGPRNVYLLGAQESLRFAEIAEALRLSVGEVEAALTDAPIRLDEMVHEGEEGAVIWPGPGTAPKWRRRLLSIWRSAG